MRADKETQLTSLLLRLPFHLFPNPLVTVLQTLSSAAATAKSLSSSGYSAPVLAGTIGDDERRVAHKLRLLRLEWCAICVEEIGRAGISEQKR